MVELAALPGGLLVREGLADLAAGRETIAALVVAVAAARLRRAGLPVPDHDWREPELALYDALRRTRPADAYSQYNSLIRQIVSFGRALEARR